MTQQRLWRSLFMSSQHAINRCDCCLRVLFYEYKIDIPRITHLIYSLFVKRGFALIWCFLCSDHSLVLWGLDMRSSTVQDSECSARRRLWLIQFLYCPLRALTTDALLHRRCCCFCLNSEWLLFILSCDLSKKHSMSICQHK